MNGSQRSGLITSTVQECVCMCFRLCALLGSFGFVGTKEIPKVQGFGLNEGQAEVGV